jgi:hypothetical protein
MCTGTNADNLGTEYEDKTNLKSWVSTPACGVRNSASYWSNDYDRQYPTP